MKLTLGVNFFNVLQAAFAPVAPKSVKRYWQFDWVLTLWGATGVKALRRTLMKSTPDAYGRRWNTSSNYNNQKLRLLLNLRFVLDPSI